MSMRTIGLLGGMSWQSTALYYQQINRMTEASLGGLHSARLAMVSVDFETIVAAQRAGRWDLAGGLLADGARALERAGADCVLICTNTMHLVADAVAAAVDIPLIDIIDATGAALLAAGRSRPLLLATAYTMQHGFYQRRMRERCGLEVVIPQADDRAEMHRIIFDELCRGIISDVSRLRVEAMIAAAREVGADSVILGCTEICLLIDGTQTALPCFDSTRIHAEEAVAFALDSSFCEEKEAKRRLSA